MSKQIYGVLDVLNTSASYKEVLNMIRNTISKIETIYPEFFKCYFDEVLSWEVSTIEENGRIDEFVITVDQLNSRQRYIKFPVNYMFMNDSELETVLRTERRKAKRKKEISEQ